MRYLFVFWVFLAGALTACSDLSVNTRKANTRQLIEAAGMQSQYLDTGIFPIQAYTQVGQSSDKPLTIYIEGDGLAWISRHKPSLDPTPINPSGLKLALADSKNQVAYLARPCQFVRNERCKVRIWTSARFSSEVIEAMDIAVSQLKAQYGVKTLQLVGYSGGGAVAALLAARRSDVTALVTVAGNLDHKAWTALQQISPLNDSLNAADAWHDLVKIPQIHFVGGRDSVMPIEVAQAYQRRFPQKSSPVIEVIEEADHQCCWVENWPVLLEQLPFHK